MVLYKLIVEFEDSLTSVGLGAINSLVCEWPTGI